jgi:ubiquinone/menaquinone biosynthesis C-methylase UbiE
MTTSERAVLPAAGRDLFLPLYDPFTNLLGVDGARRTLLEQAALQSHHRVLDVGCGTGSLAVLIRRLYPGTEVIGLDPDPKALARARRKAARAGVSIRFDRGFSDALDYRAGTFDRVFSSMMFHHLPNDDKAPTLAEIRRVLKPGGRLELLDFAGPDTHAPGMLARLIHSHHRLTENSAPRILELLTAAGLEDARKIGDQRTLFGHIAFYQASAPAISSRPMPSWPSQSPDSARGTPAPLP